MTLTTAPVLESQNLILRGPEKEDAEKVITFLLDEDRSRGFGSSPDRSDAWRWFSTNVGHWHWHGYGYFMIETKLGGAGGAGVNMAGSGNGRTYPYEVDGMSMDDER